MPIYRGVNGVNREITDQFRGFEGVNRRILEQWRGVEGVNRRVFNKVKIYSVLLNLQYLEGSYEIKDYGTYLFVRINGKHINGNTDVNRVAVGWEVRELTPGDVVEFTYEFIANPSGVTHFDLWKGDVANPGTVVRIDSGSGATSVTVGSGANRARLAINCGSIDVADKSLRITKITLNDKQIYP